MAGGVGSRFWPVSRESHPKQFLDILGTGKSFLQQTVERFTQIIPKENILIVTGANYAALTQEQLPDFCPEQILCEPLRRNTAPCIAYAAYKILKRNPNATMVVTPADHHIAIEADFLQVMQSGLHLAANNEALITVGLKPSRPETNYGYIQINTGETLNMGAQKVYRVKTFTEKPNAELARVFVESGEFLWNSGIFIWSVNAICRALATYLPDVASLFEKGSIAYGTGEEKAFIAQAYAQCPSISIDYGIMEKAENVYCFAANFGWSDLGTWLSLYIHKDKDKHGNVIDAPENMFYNVSNSVVIASGKQKLIVLHGLKNYLVVDSDDVLLVCPNEDEPFKAIVKDVPVKKGGKYM
jgi:mannose-1-phosphate guanylyltransferase